MPVVTFLPSARVTASSWSLTLILAWETWPWSILVRTSEKPSFCEEPELLTTSFWATKASRMTIRIGKAALLKNLLTRLRG